MAFYLIFIIKIQYHIEGKYNKIEDTGKCSMQRIIELLLKKEHA